MLPRNPFLLPATMLVLTGVGLIIDRVITGVVQCQALGCIPSW